MLQQKASKKKYADQTEGIVSQLEAVARNSRASKLIAINIRSR